jgi:hypothetical protein
MLGAASKIQPLRSHPPACRAGAEGEGSMTTSDFSVVIQCGISRRFTLVPKLKAGQTTAFGQP